MTLSNRRVWYQIAESGQNVSLIGEVSIIDGQNSFSIVGSFLDSQDQSVGNFSYSEPGNGTVDKAINSVTKIYQQDAETLLASVIVSAKTELNIQ